MTLQNGSNAVEFASQASHAPRRRNLKALMSAAGSAIEQLECRQLLSGSALLPATHLLHTSVTHTTSTSTLGHAVRKTSVTKAGVKKTTTLSPGLKASSSVIVPTSPTLATHFATAGTGDGWSGQYYSDASGGDATNPVPADPIGDWISSLGTSTLNYTSGVFSRIDTTINNTAGNSTTIAAPSGPLNGYTNFTVRWDGYVKIATTGYYTFFPASDDGIDAYINTTPYTGPSSDVTTGNGGTASWVQLDNKFTTPRGVTTDTSPLTTPLNAGSIYHIVVDFRQQGGGWGYSFQWAASSTAANQTAANYDVIKTQQVPAAQIFSAPPDAVQNLTAVGGPGSVALTWSEPPANPATGQQLSGAASQFTIIRSTSSTFPTGTGTVTVGTVAATGTLNYARGTYTFTDSTVNYPNTYYYEVIPQVAGPTGLISGAPTVLSAKSVGPAAISVQFVGVPEEGGTPVPIPAGATAGEVPEPNWNTFANGGPSSSSNATVIDSTGATVTGATVSWTSPDLWATGVNPTTPNQDLLSGFLDSSPPQQTTATVSNLPASITSAGYSVVVYLASDATGRWGTYTATDGTTTLSYYGVQGSGRSPDGVFYQATGQTTNTTATNDTPYGNTGNYIVFTGLTGSNVTVTSQPTNGGFRANIDGLQIIPNVTSAVAPVGPVPGPIGSTVVNATRSGTATAPSITLNWSAVQFAQTYSVIRYPVTYPGGVATYGSPTTVASNLTGTTYTDTSIANATTDYAYVVQTFDSTATNSPTSSLQQIVGHGDGFNASYYYDGPTVQGTKPSSGDAAGTVLGFARIDSTINFNNNYNTNNTPPNAPASWSLNEQNAGVGVGQDFAVRWQGSFEAPVTGYYNFLVQSDDGVGMSVFNPNTNAWVQLPNYNLTQTRGIGNPDVDAVPFQFTAGAQYQIQMDYNQGAGGWGAVLQVAASTTTANQSAQTYDALPVQVVPQQDVIAASALAPATPGPVWGTYDAANPTTALAKDSSFYALQLTPENAAIAAVWNNIDAASYNVYLLDTTANPAGTPAKLNATPIAANQGGAFTYNITTDPATAAALINGHVYQVIVTAIDAYTGAEQTLANGTSATTTPSASAAPNTPPSAIASGTPGAVTGEAVAAPGTLNTLTAATTITYSAVPNATSYNVYSSTSASGPFTTPAATGVTGTTATVQAPLGTTTYFEVAGVNANGTGPLSAATAVSTVNGALFSWYSNETWGTGINNGTASNGNSVAPGVLYVPPSGSGGGPGALIPATSAGLLPNLNLNTNNNTTPPPYGTLGNSFTDVNTGQINTGGNGAGTYTIFAATDDAGILFVNGQLVSEDLNGHGVDNPPPTVKQITLSANTSYSFVFYHDQGPNGGYSIQLHWKTPNNGNDNIIPQGNLVTTDSAPGDVTGLALDSAATQFGATIDFTTTDTNALRYVLQRSTDAAFDAAGNVQNVNSVGIVDISQNTSVKITDSTAQPNTAYYYRVVAENMYGSAAGANALQVTTAASTASSIAYHVYNNQFWASPTQNTNGYQTPSLTPNYANVFGSPIFYDGASGTSEPSGHYQFNFSDVFTGQIVVSTAGTYHFGTDSDDDSYLVVNGQLVASWPGGHGYNAVAGADVPPTNPASATGMINLTPGTYNIQYYQSQGGGGWHMDAMWEEPGQTTYATIPLSSAGSDGIISSVETTPAAATNLTATSNAGFISLNFTDNSVSEIEYLVQRSTDAAFDAAGNVVTFPAPFVNNSNGGPAAGTITDSTVVAGTKYYYRIAAVNYDGQSAYTTLSGGIVASNVLQAVTNVAAIQGAYGATVSWTNPNAAGEVSGFLVERSTDAAFDAAGHVTTVTTASGTTTSIYDPGPLAAGTTYWYRVTPQPATGFAPATSSTVSASGMLDLPVYNPITFASNSLLGDGSFESPAVNANTFAYAPTRGLWTFTNQSGVINSPSGFNAPAPVDGAQVAFVQGGVAGGTPTPNPGVITQAITVPTAGNYVFSVYDAARAGFANPTYQVILDPGAADQTTLLTGAPTSNAFTLETGAAVALSAGPHTVQISSLDSVDATTFFDDASLVSTVAPPATFNKLSLNGGASLSPSGLELTSTGAGGEGRSAFETSGVPLTGNFSTTFDFQLTQPSTVLGDAADGFTFALQANNPTIIGGTGGALGIQGIGKSVAIDFNMYNGVTQTGLVVNGASPNGSYLDLTGGTTYPNVSGSIGNAFHVLSGLNSLQTDIFHVSISYNATSQTIVETIVDTGSPLPGGTGTTTATVTYTGVNIATDLGNGGAFAYPGFTGATGGSVSHQNILDWNFTTPTQAPAPATATPGNNQVTLNWTAPAYNGSAALTYNVYRGLTSGGESTTPLASGLTGTSYVDTTAVNGTKYFYTIVAVDSVGASAPVEVSATPVASGVVPTVASSAVGTGAVQRSTVSSVSVTFNEPVNFNGMSFSLLKQALNANGTINTGVAPTDVSSGVTATSTDNITWTFTVVPGGSLDRTGAGAKGFMSNGVYQLVLHGSNITDKATSSATFNGGADKPVSFSSAEATGGTSNYFHVLFGDINGDGTVNATDYFQFKKDYLATTGNSNYNAAFDFNGDGTINATDYFQFKKDYLVAYSY